MSEDFRLSVSKTKTFIDCKKKYNFCYILKLPRKDRDYHIFGKFCHRVLEWFHEQYIAGCLLPYNVVMTDAFKIAWSEYKDKMTPEMRKECWDIINQYLKLISKDKADGLPLNVVAVEKKFELIIADKLMLNGAIDRIQLDDDNVWHLADYKTTKNKKYLKDDWFQLMTYGLILLNEKPDLKKVRLSYILLRHDFEYITKEFSAEEILSVKDRYIKYAEEILSEQEFAPNPTKLCSYCDYLGQCDAGQKQTRQFSGEVEW